MSKAVPGLASPASKKVYHYAPWATVPAIVASDALICSSEGAVNQKPLLWFSANQHWEPTATKMYVRNGVVHGRTFEEQNRERGCVRFGLSASDLRLRSWGAACRFAGIGRTTQLHMETVGIKLGADPSDWFATSAPISLSALDFQVYGDDAWHDAIPREMADVWKQARVEPYASHSVEFPNASLTTTKLFRPILPM